MIRFPEEGYVLPELALRELQSAGYRALTGAEFAAKRALDNDRGSLSWRVYPHTDTLVGVGLFRQEPTLLVRHGDHVLSTPEGCERLRAQGPKRYKFQLLSETDRALWKRYCEEGLEEKGGRRKTWVIQGKVLEGLILGVCNLDKAPDYTAMVPMLGDIDSVSNYSKGHRANFGNQIGVWVDKNATNSEVPLVCGLVFGEGYRLYGNDGFGDECFVGVPFSAEGAAQKIFEPQKDSPLALILKE